MRRTKDDAERTRIAILDAAEQVFCEQGVAGATLEKISRAAGVTRGALYWHFADKTDLLRALHERAAPPQVEIILLAADEENDDPLGMLEAAAIEMLRLFEHDESRQRLFLIMSNHVASDVETEWLQSANADMSRALTALTAQARAQGRLNPDFTPEEAAVIMMATMNGLLSEWLRRGKSFPLAELGAKFVAAQTRMMSAGDGALLPSS